MRDAQRFGILMADGQALRVIGIAEHLRDPDDDMLLECAVASGCPFIVTHNVKDFQRAGSLNVRAIRPGDFLKLLRSPR